MNMRPMARPDADGHPDLDLLNAFAEGALGREKRRLIEHLADCARCRQLLDCAMAVRSATGAEIATALDALPAATFTLPPDRNGLAFWRWAVPISALAVIGIVMLLPVRPANSIVGVPPASLAPTATGPIVVVRPRFRHAVRAAAEAQALAARSGHPSHSSAAALHTLAAVNGPPAGAPGAAAPAAAPATATALAAATAPNSAAPAPAAARLTSPAGFTPGSSGFLDQSHNVAAALNVLANGSSLDATDMTTPAPATAAPLIDAVDYVTPSAPGASGFSSAGGAAFANPGVYRPQISPDRALQVATAGLGAGVSYLGGVARVAAHTVSAGYLGSRRASATDWQLSTDGELLRAVGAGFWQTVPVGNSGKLTALSVTDSEIWTGGLTSELYVSRDGGETFHSVTLAGAREHPARIVAISFTTAQQGIITTADGRFWTTLDGGRHWDVYVP